MAIEFTDTEPLAKPINVRRATAILEQYSKLNNFVSATAISEEAFFAVYREGTAESHSKPTEER